MHVVRQVGSPSRGTARRFQSIQMLKEIARPVGVLKRNDDVAFIVNRQPVVNPPCNLRRRPSVIQCPLDQEPKLDIVRMNLEPYSRIEFEPRWNGVQIGQPGRDPVAQTSGQKTPARMFALLALDESMDVAAVRPIPLILIGREALSGSRLQTTRSLQHL